MDEDAKSASLVLLRFVTDKEAKLRYGAKLRASMQASISRGEEPSGYRVEWILQTVSDIFTWLGTRAAEFNAKHPQDRVSADDFSDILATASARLKKSRKP